METAALVMDAFRELGLDARVVAGAPANVHLVVEPEGAAVDLLVERKSLVSEELATRLVARGLDRALLVVGDRVTERARQLLTSHHAGYLDLRGRLALSTRTIVIDAEVTPLKQRAARVDPLSGTAGLEVAVELLLAPGRDASVRELARQLGRSPGTVSEVLKALRHEGLIDESNHVVGTDLFWSVADRWSTPRTLVAQLPDPDDPSTESLRLGLDDETGWAAVGTVAAAGYGAPVVARADQAPDFYVPDATTARRAITLLGAAPTAASARASIRVAPVPAVVSHRVIPNGHDLNWPTAHPLFVALDLALDRGRGREILEAWTPPGDARVW